MVSTTEGSNNNSPMSPSQYMTVKNSNAKNSLHQFLEALDVKHKTAVRRLGADELKKRQSYKVIICGQSFQSAMVI